MTTARADDDVTAFVAHDRHFHEVIVAAAGNAVLTGTYQSLRDRQLTIVATQMRMSGSRLDEALRGHDELVALLRDGTRAAFATAVRHHVESAIARLQVSR